MFINIDLLTIITIVLFKRRDMLRCCSWMDGGIRHVVSKCIRRNCIKQTTPCRGRRLMLHVHCNVRLAHCTTLQSIPTLSNTKLDLWIKQFRATRCCNSPKMPFFSRNMIDHGPHFFTGKGPMENKNIKDRARILWIPPSVFPWCSIEMFWSKNFRPLSDDSEF